MLGKTEGKRRRSRQRERWLDSMHLNGPEFEQTSGVGDGQGNLECCSLLDYKESDMTERLENNNIIQ